MSLFAHPERIWLLALVPLMAWWVARGGRKRVRSWRALGQGGRPWGDGSWSWLGAMVLLVLALGGPRWGRVPGDEPEPGHDVIMLIDVSRSMGAEDAVPDRLGVAVQAAKSLIGALGHEPGDRVAVVEFAGRGVVRCALTEYLGAAVEALEALQPGEVQPGGTNLAAGLETALAAFDDQERAEGRTVVLFSDGEDHAGTWRALESRLRAAGVLVHAVAIGDPDRGHPVPSGINREPLIYQGEPVSSRRSDVALEALAEATGGALVRLGLKTTDLGKLYESRIAPMVRQIRAERSPPERAERFAIFVAAALAIGVAGCWPRNRLALAWLAPVLVLLGSGMGPWGEGGAEAVATGRREYQAGRYTSALTAFDRAGRLAPDQAVPLYDSAATLYQLGRFSEALTRYRQARERADAPLRTRIDYGLGNTSLALGDFPAAIRHYNTCLSSRVPGPAFDAIRRDALINRQFAEDQSRRPPPVTSREGPGLNRSPNPEPKEDPPAQEPRPGESQTKSSAPGAIGTEGANPATRPSGAGHSGGPGTHLARPGSPDARLDEALRHVQEALRLRLEDPPPPAADTGGKDW